jgi:hypothetical protein
MQQDCDVENLLDCLCNNTVLQGPFDHGCFVHKNKNGKNNWRKTEQNAFVWCDYALDILTYARDRDIEMQRFSELVSSRWLAFYQAAE